MTRKKREACARCKEKDVETLQFMIRFYLGFKWHGETTKYICEKCYSKFKRWMDEGKVE